MVSVAIGPAHSMLRPILSQKSVGSQFFVAQPGTEIVAKKKRMTQKATLENMEANERTKDSDFVLFVFFDDAAAP